MAEPQTPQFELPGAEYFALAPGRTIAIQGRRRFSILANSVSIPANQLYNIQENDPAVTGNLIMEQPFPPGAALYIHKADLIVIPLSPTLDLEIVSASFGFRTNTQTATSFYLLGTPLLNFATPSNVQQLASTERDLLVTERDIELYSYPARVEPSVLQVAFNVSIKNTVTGAETVTVAARFIYTRLDGFVE